MKTKKIKNHLEGDSDGSFEGFDKSFKSKNGTNARPAKARHKFRSRLREALAYAHDQIRDPETRAYYRTVAARRNFKNSFQAAVQDYLESSQSNDSY